MLIVQEPKCRGSGDCSVPVFWFGFIFVILLVSAEDKVCLGVLSTAPVNSLHSF